MATLKSPMAITNVKHTLQKTKKNHNDPASSSYDQSITLKRPLYMHKPKLPKAFPKMTWPDHN